MQFTIQEINKQFKKRLKDVYSNKEIDQILFIIYENVLNLTKIQVLVDPDMEIKDDKFQELLLINERLFSNEPIQYILGETEFFDLRFNVNSSVLIPRQETEELVQWIIDDETDGAQIIDMGTGSGCIAISLSKNMKNTNVYAVDVSDLALDIAKDNAILNSVPVKFIIYNILEDNYANLPQKIDVLVSNPPYVMQRERMLMQRNVLDYEPDLALFVTDDNPLIFYKKLALIGKKILKKGGKVFFEINEALGKDVEIMLEDMNFSNVEIRKDINGKDRMVKGVS